MILKGILNEENYDVRNIVLGVDIPIWYTI